MIGYYEVSKASLVTESSQRKRYAVKAEQNVVIFNNGDTLIYLSIQPVSKIKPVWITFQQMGFFNKYFLVLKPECQGLHAHL